MRTSWTRSLGLAAALAVAACGEDAASTFDGDVLDATDDASDAGGDAADDTAGDTAEDAAEDATADTAEDAASDVAIDGEADAEEDVAADAEEDVEPDVPIECPTFDTPVELPEPDRYTPRWAFEPWISKDISDGPDTYAFVDGFIERHIPVGVVVLDSPWETNYNTFVPNPDRYPDFEQMIDDMAARDVRVVLWVTQMINDVSYDLEAGGDTYLEPSPNFAVGEACGYFVNDGRTYNWWKGFGAGIDFFNPDAVRWWRAQQDALLDMGIAGWKLDFGEEYITGETYDTFAGEVTRQAYSEEYYRDFLAYGADRVGVENFVTMVRPWDESYGFDGRFFARPEHAPVAWVGDNRRDWIGLEDALDHIFRSAAEGYVVVGSDIGGYLDRDDLNLLEDVPFDPENFMRWVAVGAMTPFMQLHGRGNLEPWNVDEPGETTVLDTYRYWATLHHEMVPFWYSLTRAAYEDGTTVIRPVGELDDWAGDYRFFVGDAFLVAPILDETGVRDVELPEGSYLDWWDRSGRYIEGGQTLEGVDVDDPGRIPLYVRAGAIVPLALDGDETGLARDSWGEIDAIFAWPASRRTEFTTYDLDGGTTTWSTQRALDALSFRSDRVPTRTLVRLHKSPEPIAVQWGLDFPEPSADPGSSEEFAWAWDPTTGNLDILLPASESPASVGVILD